MDADYDVRVPNDYNEVKELMRTRREAIEQMAKARQAENAMKRSGGILQQDDEDYESESEEDDDDSYRRNKMGRFAPPAIYNQTNSTTTAFTPESSTSHIVSSSTCYDGNDDDDEKPYLSPPPRPPLDNPHPVSSVQPLAVSGEEAYQRRLAMSQGLVPPPSSSSMTAPSMKTEFPSPPPLPDLASRAAAAAAIAARLSKVAPASEHVSKPPPPSFVASTGQIANSASFAEDLMKKQGWKKGEALGVEGNKGILDPILAQKVEAERRKQARSGDRQQQANRGTLVNAREEERRNEEREKFGTVSNLRRCL